MSASPPPAGLRIALRLLEPPLQLAEAVSEALLGHVSVAAAEEVRAARADVPPFPALRLGKHVEVGLWEIAVVILRADHRRLGLADLD